MREEHPAWLPAWLPGLALAAGVAAAASVVAMGPVSPILLAVFLGLLVRNAVALHSAFDPGLELCVRRVLRVGVALLGIGLSLAAVATLGLRAVPIVAACIAAALLFVVGLARALRLPTRLGWLIAAGTSICGITAIVAVAPVIDADETETSYAVATIALFGMLALFTYPYLAHALFHDPVRSGLFLGTSIHDTSQVVGAALAYQEQYAAPRALETAVVTKLVRNLSMIVVIPGIGLLHRSARGAQGGRGTDVAGGEQGSLVPLFVVGFLAMAVVRTTGDLGDVAFGVLPAAVWAGVVAAVQHVAEVALLVAMAAVGLRTRLGPLWVLGLRPLAAGLGAALVVGLVSAAMIHLGAG